MLGTVCLEFLEASTAVSEAIGMYALHCNLNRYIVTLLSVITVIGSGIGKPRLSQDLWFSYLACCAFKLSQFSSNDLHRWRCGDQHTRC